MTYKKSDNRKIKAGFLTVLIIAIVSSFLITSNIPSNMNPVAIDKNDDATWHLVQVVEDGKIVLGENATSGSEGWSETFFLKEAETPETFLAYNGTYEGYSASVIGYCDADGDTIDLASETEGYIVVRIAFDSRSKNGASWDWGRYKVYMNATGNLLPSTISAIAESDNSSDASGHYGDAVVSTSGTGYIWVNFWWDCGNDANNYYISDDGTINWSIHIYEKY
jgi:hypothetical protein